MCFEITDEFVVLRFKMNGFTFRVLKTIAAALMTLILHVNGM